MAVTVILIVSVSMTAAVIFMLAEAIVVAHIAIAVPLVVMVEMSAGTIPVTGIVAAAFMAGNDPVSTGVGRTAPITFMPAVVACNRVPITADPDIVGFGLRGHYDDCARRWRRADLNADRYLSFGRNACQQERGKGGSPQ